MKNWFQFTSPEATRYGSGSEGEARRYYRELELSGSAGRFVMSRLALGDEPPKDARQFDMAVELAKTARPR